MKRSCRERIVRHRCYERENEKKIGEGEPYLRREGNTEGLEGKRYKEHIG